MLFLKLFVDRLLFSILPPRIWRESQFWWCHSRSRDLGVFEFFCSPCGPCFYYVFYILKKTIKWKSNCLGSIFWNISNINQKLINNSNIEISNIQKWSTNNKMTNTTKCQPHLFIKKYFPLAIVGCYCLFY